MQVALTLIHGTWAKGAAWSRADSVFVKDLTTALGDEVTVVDVSPHDWSGGNSGLARRAAAATLTNRIQEVATRWPNVPHFVIGHSHGGTVALYAIKRAEVRRAIAGILCLSTPVYHFRRRSPNEEISLVAYAGIAVVLGIVLVRMLLGHPLVDFVTKALVVVEFLTGAVLLYYLSVSGPRILATWRYPKVKFPIVFLRRAGDEATGALGAARLGSWLLQKVLLVGDKSLPFLFAALVALAAVGILSTQFGFTVTGFEVARVLVVVPGIAVLVIVPLASLIIILIGFGFGWDAGQLVFVAEMSAEQTLSGRWLLHQFSFGSKAAPKAFFEHSAIYTEPEAIRAMAETIRELVVAQRAQRANS